MAVRRHDPPYDGVPTVGEVGRQPDPDGLPVSRAVSGLPDVHAAPVGVQDLDPPECQLHRLVEPDHDGARCASDGGPSLGIRRPHQAVSTHRPRPQPHRHGRQPQQDRCSSDRPARGHRIHPTSGRAFPSPRSQTPERSSTEPPGGGLLGREKAPSRRRDRPPVPGPGLASRMAGYRRSTRPSSAGSGGRTWRLAFRLWHGTPRTPWRSSGCGPRPRRRRALRARS